MPETAETIATSNDINSSTRNKSFIPRLTGTRYYSVLKSVHENLKPRSYLEIGIRRGDSLSLSKCPSIGIDPRFDLDPKYGLENTEREPPIHLQRMTSDKFFAEKNPLEILGVSQIDFQFLDGMHQSDYLLRDIINAEHYAGRNSIIALHDCLPLDIPMTFNPQQRKSTPYPIVYPGLWTGDVWRVVPILKKYRPDISLYCMDSAPTGLVLMTNLDSKSTILKDKHDHIVREMNSLNLGEIGIPEYVDSLPVIPTREFLDADGLKRRFSSW